MKHRPSSLKTFDSCPFRALHEYYGGGAAMGPEYSGYATGSAFHSMMEAYINGGEPDFTGLPVESCREAMKIYERYVDESQFNPDDVLFCEVPISHGRMTGIPDLVMSVDKKTVLIFDFKTAWTEQGTEYDSLGMYAAIMAMNNPDIKTFILRVCLVRYMAYLPDVILTDGDALDTWDIMANKMNRIEAAVEEPDLWPATPGRHCDYCRVRAVCPRANLDLATAGMIADLETATEIAKDTLALKAFTKESEDNLKAWCKDNGPIKISDTESYGFNMGTRIEYTDPLAVEKLFDEEDRRRIIRFDSTKMKKLREKDALLDDDLKRYETVKPSSRFGLMKE